MVGSPWKQRVLKGLIAIALFVSGAFFSPVFGEFGNEFASWFLKLWNNDGWISAEAYIFYPPNSHADNSHRGQINSICTTRKYLVTGSDDHTLKVWSLKTSQIVYTIKGLHQGDIQDIICEGDVVISSGNDSKLHLIDLDKKRYKLIYKDKDGHSLLSLTTHNHALYVGDDNNIISLDTNDGYKFLRQYVGHDDQVYDINSNEKYLVSVSKDRSIIYFDQETGRIIKHIHNAHDMKIHSADIYGKYLVTSAGGNLIIWEIPTDNIIFNTTVQAHTGMNEVILTKNRAYIASHQSRSIEIIEFKDDYRTIIKRQTVQGKDNHESIFLYNECLFAGTVKGQLEFVKFGGRLKIYSIDENQNYDLDKLCESTIIDNLPKD